MRINIALIIMFLFCFGGAFAQGNGEEPQTLFGNKKIDNGGYGGVEAKATQINNEWGLLLGARGGWIIDHCFSIGGGGYGIVTNHIMPDYMHSDDFDYDNYDSTVYIRMGYGGLFFEYSLSPNSVFHFNFNALIGAGALALTGSIKDAIKNSEEFNFEETWTHESSSFFVFEPGASAELNVTSFFRIAINASFRFISGLKIENDYVKSGDISGLSAGIIFKFGKF